MKRTRKARRKYRALTRSDEGLDRELAQAGGDLGGDDLILTGYELDEDLYERLREVLMASKSKAKPTNNLVV